MITQSCLSKFSRSSSLRFSSSQSIVSHKSKVHPTDRASRTKWLENDFTTTLDATSNLRSPYRILHDGNHPRRHIKTLPPPPSTRKAHPFALQDFTASHLAMLDPNGARRRLFARENPDAPRVGDILLTTFKSGNPFAGVCLNIRHCGVDTAILLRTKKLTVGVEMWVKIFSPNVRAIEVVKRSVKKQRRARLYFMRLPKHDKGSVDTEVERYLSRRRLIRSGAVSSGPGGKEGVKGSI